MRSLLLVAACGAAAPRPIANDEPPAPQQGDVRDPPRVIAGRWAITTSSPMPFPRENIERGFQDAHDDIAACLESALLPMITATVRLTWSGGRLTATVVDEDRGLGQCAALALEKVSWLAPPTATLDVIVTSRRSE